MYLHLPISSPQTIIVVSTGVETAKMTVSQLEWRRTWRAGFPSENLKADTNLNPEKELCAENRLEKLKYGTASNSVQRGLYFISTTREFEYRGL